MIRLSDDEIRFFAREGYIIKRGVLDPHLMERARDCLWQGAPPPLVRDDPDSWVGPFKREDECGDTSSHRHGYGWQFREPGGEPWMRRLLATDPSVWGMTEQLLGERRVIWPEGIRGIYCILPEGEAPERPMSCHVDGHAFHLGVVGYIDDVPPRGGGFTVWPRSHATFFRAFRKQYSHERVERYDEIHARVDPHPYVDCHGAAGDIVFWHHRLGHSAGHNRSRQIRQAVLYDFARKDIGETDGPPPKDMWRDWPGIRALTPPP